MRTALILLFLLALASLPGALLPQWSLNSSKTAQYIADHPTLGPWLDRLGFFEVFASPWYAAIYLLLFTSLVGCLLPRTWEFVGQLRCPTGGHPAQPRPAAASRPAGGSRIGRRGRRPGHGRPARLADRPAGRGAPGQEAVRSGPGSEARRTRLR